MQERYDFPKRRPATRTLNRFSLLKTSPCAQRKDSGCVFTAMYYILVIFCTLPPRVYRLFIILEVIIFLVVRVSARG